MPLPFSSSGRSMAAPLRTTAGRSLRRPLGPVAALLALAAFAATGAAASDVLAGAAADEPDVSLSIMDAVILGLVEGITEYLPVSSTGHLLAATEILGLGGTEAADEALDTYAICIQSGAILAVLFLYKNRIWQMVDGLIGRSEEGRRVLLAVVAAFVPTAVIGTVIYPVVRDRLFGLAPIATAWVVGGIGILWLVRSGFLNRDGFELAELTTRHAATIGLLQAIAIWPGVSRSLVTIVAGVLVGMNLRSSVEFSFLLGLVTLTAATVYAGLDGGADLVDQFGVTAPLVGLVVAFVSAILAIRWMVTWLESRDFGVFGWYRIAIGSAAFVALGAGWL